MNNNTNPGQALQPTDMSSSLVAQKVQRANRQLELAGQVGKQLIAKDERHRWVALFTSIKSKDAVNFLSLRMALPQDLLERYENLWSWEGLSNSKSLPWSLELIERFENLWSWEGLSNSKSLPWSLELIERFENLWNWESLSNNESLPWSLELIERFENLWNWERLTNNESLPWSLELIERFENLWDWELLTNNESLPWSLELLEHFVDKWWWYEGCGYSRFIFSGFSGLSNNESLPWSLELLEHFKDRWDWGSFIPPTWQSGLSTNKTLPWSLELLEHFKDRWDWDCLSNNNALPWSLELLECFENKWVWRRWDDADDSRGLSENRSLPWSIELLERFEERWDWSALSHNESLPWTMELLVRFKDRWDWSALSAHKSLPWADLWKIFHVTTSQFGNEIPESYWQRWLDDPNIPRNLLEQYKDQWRWSIRSDNEIRDEILDYYDHDPELGESVWLRVLKRLGDKDKWDWALLSQITSLVFESDSLPWPTDLVMDYDDYEDYEELKTNIMLGMSLSESVPWSAELIECIDNHFDEERHNSDWNWEGSYKEKLFWRHHEEVWARLSRNKSLPWSQELTERFRYLRNLCEQEPAVWTIELLEHFEEGLDWADLSYKKSLPWSIELLEHFQNRWGWSALSHNESLPWSIELLEHFQDRWDWGRLSYNTSLPKLPLTAQDIDNVMQNIANVE